MTKKKEQVSGITLVTLVVTIIVLLILAGVAITFIIGDNGLISRAKNAATTYEMAQKNELAELDKMANYISSNGGTWGSGEESGDSEEEPLTPSTATEADILEGKTAYTNNKTLLVGTMKNRGILNANLNKGETLTIPEGYYSGGEISADNAYQAGVNDGKPKRTTEWLLAEQNVYGGAHSIFRLSVSGYSQLLYCWWYSIGSGAHLTEVPSLRAKPTVNGVECDGLEGGSTQNPIVMDVSDLDIIVIFTGSSSISNEFYRFTMYYQLLP